MTISLISLGFLLGLRHGVDWDHIAAITDLAGAADGRRHGFGLATLYALGHAGVVILLGLLALWFGALLPGWVDGALERLVGVTLLLLAAWIFYTLRLTRQTGAPFRLKSRWMVLLEQLPRHRRARKISARTACGIGALHGIGAETGSQALLLAGIAGVTTPVEGSLLLAVFVCGLVLSNSAIALLALSGFSAGSRLGQTATRLTGAGVGVFSLLVGLLFIAGQSQLLPQL